MYIHFFGNFRHCLARYYWYGSTDGPRTATFKPGPLLLFAPSCLICFFSSVIPLHCLFSPWLFHAPRSRRNWPTCLRHNSSAMGFLCDLMWDFLGLCLFVARVPDSLGGPGVGLCSPKVAFAVASARNRPQLFAAGRGLESESSGLVTPQLYWRLQRRCLCEWSMSPQLYWRLQRRLRNWSVAPQFYWRLQRRCLREWFVAPQVCWRLQRRCLCEWSVGPQFCWRLQRRCLCEWSVAPQVYWRLQRRCLCEWSVAPQVLLAFAGKVSVWATCGAGCPCPTRVSSKSVLQECQVWLCHRIKYKSVLEECQVGVSYKSVKSERRRRVSRKSSYKSVK